MSDRGVVAVWADERWVVATPREDSQAVVLYEVSEGGELLSGPRAVELGEQTLPLNLVDTARSPSTGELGIFAEREFISVSPGLESAEVTASVGSSDCFLRRLEHALDLFVFVSVRFTFEGTISVLETPGTINGNPGLYQKELLFLRTDCRSLAFAPWVNPDGGLGVDFMYARPTSQGTEFVAYRLYDRNGSTWGTAGLGNLSAPIAPDLNAPTRLDLVRTGPRSVTSFRDLLQNGTRYLLLDEFAFTVADEIVQHAPLRLAAPMKGDDEGFVQAVVVEASPRQLQFRELWTGDVPYSSRILALGDVEAVHLARGSEGAFAVAIRVAPPAISSPGVLLPGLYLFGITRDEELFRTKLPDL
jgi:hypothetical protein